MKSVMNAPWRLIDPVKAMAVKLAEQPKDRCPGFVGADGERRVIIEPAYVIEAVKWLKRRFYVSENLDISDNGLCIELEPKARVRSMGKRRTFFEKPHQFELSL